MEKTLNICPKCNSQKIIKFGKTKSGSARFKCKVCSKTWTQSSKKDEKPPMHLIVGKYFDGASIRDLVPLYKSSPHRINSKIREYLSITPHWESFIDSKFSEIESEMIYLTGQNFSCNCEHDDCNNNYLAMAVDAHSSFILGYEISISNKTDVWDKLFERLSERNIKCKRFISNGGKDIDDSIKKYYPDSEIQVSVLRTLRNKEIACCLDNNPKNTDLIEDVDDIYKIFSNQNLVEIISESKNLKSFLNDNSDRFFSLLRQKCGTKIAKKIENLSDNFKERFERFRMVKCEPYPLVNGWVAYNMLHINSYGFNRLMLFKQDHDRETFASFMNEKELEENKFNLDEFVLESSARFLQLPLNRVSIKNISPHQILSFA